MYECDCTVWTRATWYFPQQVRVDMEISQCNLNSCNDKQKKKKRQAENVEQKQEMEAIKMIYEFKSEQRMSIECHFSN